MTLYEIFMMPVELFKIAFALVIWGVMVTTIYEFVFKWLDANSLIERVKKWLKR